MFCGLKLSDLHLSMCILFDNGPKDGKEPQTDKQARISQPID